MDGHYWVERDGKVIDPYFKDYDFMKLFWNLTDEQVWLPAPPLIQEIFKKKMVKKFEGTKKIIERWTNTHGFCDVNAVSEFYENGGTIVFGSMGWKKKDGSGIHYEFGGENYTVAQFLLKK